MNRWTSMAACVLVLVSTQGLAQNRFLDRGRQLYESLSPAEQAAVVRMVMEDERQRAAKANAARRQALPDSMENAKKLEEANNKADAFQMYARLANAGNLDAMVEQASMQINGVGTASDPEAGNRLMHEASNRGSGLAAQRIGTMLALKAPFQEWWSWIELAAERNDGYSQVMVGHRLEAGPNVKHDLRAAMGWYKRAITNKSALGYYSLAQMYEAGRGVKRNKLLAAALYPEDRNLDVDRLRLQATLSPDERVTADSMRGDIRSATLPLKVIEAIEAGKWSASR